MKHYTSKMTYSEYCKLTSAITPNVKAMQPHHNLASSRESREKGKGKK